MKKIVSLVFVAMLAATAAVSLTACDGEEPTPTPESSAVVSEAEEPTSEPVASMVNPWIDCKDLKEAQEKAGFDFQVPENASSVYRVIPDEMIEVVQDQDGREVVYRKSPTDGDISGDYNEYNYTGNKTIDGVKVVVCGNGAKKVHVGSFTAFDGTYSVTCSDDLAAHEMFEIFEELIALNAK